MSRRPSFYEHLHPPTVPDRESRLSYTFGLGGITALSFVVLVVTGMLEMFLYIPTPDLAYDSLQQLIYQAPFGWLVRNMHFWAAQGMVISATLHMARVVFSGGYKRRRFNWLIGLSLLTLTLLADFTGYVLRWDERAGWALTVGTNLLPLVPLLGDWLHAAVTGVAQGELALGPSTLIRFYAWHIFGLILPLFALLVWHLFRWRRDGGISSRGDAPRRRAIAADTGTAPPRKRRERSDLIREEVFTALAALALLVVFSVVFPAPLGTRLDASPAGAHTHAPWILLWVQELLRVWSPGLAGVFVPLALTALLGLLPYVLDRRNGGVAVWFNREGRAAQVVFTGAALAVVGLSLRAALR